MNTALLKQLCDADAIASNEGEVRDILRQEWCDVSDERFYDHLGSMISFQKGYEQDAVKVMFCAHMDEVGFQVRHISDIGFLYLIVLGGVQDRSKHMQKVRITTSSNQKVYGVLNVTSDIHGKVVDMYVDIGVESRAEAESLDIETGNMVCFASESFSVNRKDVMAGKAMDDRSGCFVITEALKQLAQTEHPCDVYMAATSSEEVGVRGGKLVAHDIQPDIVFAIDVANHPELDRGFTNHRKIGQGFMIVHYDKTLAPNRKLLNFVKDIADRTGLMYQCDMFSGGGTDAGNALLEHGGRLAMVIGIPLRMCHSAWSLVHQRDMEGAVAMIVALCKALRRENYTSFIDFEGGN